MIFDRGYEVLAVTENNSKNAVSYICSRRYNIREELCILIILQIKFQVK
jgi:hypothetical protein